MRSLKKAWRYRSLRAKLILSSVCCVLLPLILSFILMVHSVQEELVNNSVEQSKDILEVLNIQLTDYFDNLLYLSNYIRFNDRLHAVMLRTIDRAEEDRLTPEAKALSDIEIARHLETVTNLLNPAVITMIIDPIYTYTNAASLDEDSDFWRGLYADILVNPAYGIHWKGVHPTYIEGEREEHPYLISIAGTIELSRRHRALLLISIHETAIQEILRDRAIDAQQEIMLVDAKGTIVSHSGNERIQQPFPLLEVLKQGESHQIVEYREKEYVLVSEPFTYGDWRLISLIPQKTAVGNIQQIMRNTLVTLLLFFFIFLALLVALVSLLTKPLERLNKVIEQVKGGNLSVRSGLRGPGDIEQLGRSLDRMMDTIERMIERIKNAEKSKRKAELEMLQAQINPHFLFNTLNSLRLKISLNGDQESSSILQSLALLLRMTFNRKDEFVPLHKEIEVVRHYLQLMNFKSNSRIELQEDIAPDIAGFLVPRFFLQPLIENSILHGFEHKSGTIKIIARSEGDGLFIRVADNGKGLSPEAEQLIRSKIDTADSGEPAQRPPSSFTGIGIDNVFGRMRLIYGNRFRLEIGNLPSGGTLVSFFIPRHHEV